MPRCFTSEQLRRLRNDVPLPPLLARLKWPHKSRGGQLTFVCPLCGESRSDLRHPGTEGPRENLLRCFHCETNFNPIDFTMAARRCDFVEAVHYLLSLDAQLSRFSPAHPTGGSHRPFFMRHPVCLGCPVYGRPKWDK